MTECSTQASQGDQGGELVLKKSFPFIPAGWRADSQGRFVTVWGHVEGSPYNFVSVYVPPQTHTATLRDLAEMILGLPPGTTLIGGDFNTMLDRERDFEGGGHQKPGSRRKVESLVRVFGLV